MNIITVNVQRGENEHQVEFEWEAYDTDHDQNGKNCLLAFNVSKIISVDNDNRWSPSWDVFEQLIEEQQLGLKEAQEQWREFCEQADRVKEWN